MSIRAWTFSGMATGAFVGAIFVVVAVALAPDPQPSAGAILPGTPTPAASVRAETTPASSRPSTGSPATPTPTGTAPRGSGTVMHVGEAAPVLVLPQVGGGFIDLAALRGRPVWVVFVASSCSECSADLSLMADYVARYSANGLVGIVVDVGESESAAAGFARRLGIALPVGLDLDGRARDEWEVVNLPAHVWVDQFQVIRAVAPSSVETQAMAERLSLILPGVTVTS